MIETIDLPKYVSSTATVKEILSSTSAGYLLFNISGREVNLTDESLTRMLDAAKTTIDECMPVVFKNGKLAGWGNEYYNREKLLNLEYDPPEIEGLGTSAGQP